jgi:hypothetical protein
MNRNFYLVVTGVAGEVDPVGVDPVGVDPAGVDRAGVDPAGADPVGVDQAGVVPGIKDITIIVDGGSDLEKSKN